MDMGDLIKMGATMFIQSKLSGDNGSGLDIGDLVSALTGLAGGDSAQASSSSTDGLDIGSILGKMQDGGMGDILSSWLGDGDNKEISSEQVTNVFGSDKISDFASKLGLSEEEAVGGLRDTLPNMVDKASNGGSILDSIGGIDGAINIASKIFGR
ncbi:MAG: DUF937 domain-containing protein [Cocleimonas sp.]|nr:DUF937 domain-containing protein [Cocleimonas sp.]